MKKTILFIDNLKDYSDLEKFFKKNKNLCIIIQEFNSKKKTNITYLEEFDKNLKETKYLYGLNWLQNWSNKKIINGKSIKEMLVYKKQTLWYFIEYLIYSGTWTLDYFTPTSKILYYIDAINYFISKYKPKKVIIKNNNKLFYNLVIKICQNKNIEIQNLNIYNKKINIGKKLKNNLFLIRTYIILRQILRFILRYFKSKKINKKIIMLSSDRFSYGNKKNNIFWGEISKNLDNKKISNKIIEYDRLWKVESLNKTYFKNYKDIEHISQYYNYEVISDSIKVAKFLKEKLKILKRNKNFKKSLNYKGINIYNFIEDRFNLIFESLSYFIGDVLGITKNILKENKNKLFLIDHEDNYYGKGLIVNSKKDKKIKIIALQHELINPITCIHRHIKSKRALDKNNFLWRPLPNYKCVSGNYAKKILLKQCNYPEEKIIITGQPRYDELTKYNKFNKKDICKKFNLDPKRKIIIYASKFLENENRIFKILSMYVNKNKIQLIFKAHPNANIPKLKKRIIESENVKLIHNINLFELLYVCDLLITVSSTVAIEAMYLNKPVLIIDLFKRCTLPFVEYGAGYGVYEFKNIIDGLEMTLYNKKIKDKLKIGRTKFLKDYMYGIDGKSTNRVINLIQKILTNI